eukprot:TRINITY_DN40593_c0_g1_i1.p1 TRINITY_DN40593_c0_g1~~TRINITY_DN40593_c0_g1_i1.p1  ORF type:complete len:335 (+),score=2.71 TRINITY_DN40593_c0_g1_i1:132-1136(+)
MWKVFLVFVTLNCQFYFGHAQEESQSCCKIEDCEFQNMEHIRDSFSHKFLIIIGVQKAGTTLLFNLMHKHPQISSSITHLGRSIERERSTKELHFFDSKNVVPFRNYLRSFNMSALLNGQMLFEATPSYIAVPHAACRISALLPNAKFVLLLRSPEERTLSFYRMSYFKKCVERNSCENEEKKRIFYNSFNSSVSKWIANIKKYDCDLLQQTWSDCFGCSKMDDGAFLNPVLRSIYAPQILSWLQYIRPEQLQILHFNETRDLQKLMDKVSKFAGLEPYQVNTSSIDGFHGNSSLEMLNLTKPFQVLRDFYAPYNELLTQVLETKFNIYNFTFN